MNVREVLSEDGSKSPSQSHLRDKLQKLLASPEGLMTETRNRRPRHFLDTFWVHWALS